MLNATCESTDYGESFANIWNWFQKNFIGVDNQCLLKVHCPVLPLKAEFSLAEEREINEIIVNIQVFDILLLCPHQKALEYLYLCICILFFCIVYCVSQKKS